MLFILILSISLNYVNYMWHGFVLPCCFNGRFTFMFILFMILIAYKSINNLKGINTKKLIIVYLIIYLQSYTIPSTMPNTLILFFIN